MTLDRLIASVKSELDLAQDSSTGHVSAPLLESARQSLESAQDQLAMGNTEGELTQLAPLAHQISDAWPYTSELGATILGYIQERRRRSIRSRS